MVIHSQCREFTVTSDASGTWGCGAYTGSKWFQLKWDDQTRLWHIAAKELILIIIAAVIWWKGSKVVAQCDNAAVVEVINKRYCQDADAEVLIFH